MMSKWSTAYDEQVVHLHSLVDSQELHHSLTQHLASRQYSTYKQTVNSHRQRLKNLLGKAGRPPQPDLDNTAVSVPDVSLLLNNTATTPPTSPSNPSTPPGRKQKCRKFLPRSQYRRRQERLASLWRTEETLAS